MSRKERRYCKALDNLQTLLGVSGLINQNQLRQHVIAFERSRPRHEVEALRRFAKSDKR